MENTHSNKSKFAGTLFGEPQFLMMGESIADAPQAIATDAATRRSEVIPTGYAAETMIAPAAGVFGFNDLKPGAYGEMKNTMFAPLVVTNARIVARPTQARISGFLLENLLAEMLSGNNTDPQINSGTSAATLTLDFTAAAGTTPLKACILFFNITSTLLQSRPGARFQIGWTTATSAINKDANGRLLVGQQMWTIERIDATKPITGYIIPYVKIGDNLAPVLLNAVTAGTDKISLEFKSLANNVDYAAVTLPSASSYELASFMRAFGYPL